MAAIAGVRSLGALLAVVGCTSPYVNVAPTPPAGAVITHPGRGVACGVNLMGVIPIMVNSRAERAYKQAVDDADATGLTDTKITDRWSWIFHRRSTFVQGNGYNLGGETAPRASNCTAEALDAERLRWCSVLDRTVAMLNADTGTTWKYEASPAVGHHVKELYVFLYRTDCVSQKKHGELVPDSGDKFIREHSFGSFRAGQFEDAAIPRTRRRRQLAAWWGPQPRLPERFAAA